MMVYFVGSIIFDILGILDSVGKGHMTPFLAVLTLRYARVHVYILNCSYKTIYIDASVNQFFHFVTTLDILNIDPNDSHVRFGGDFDNSKS